MNKLFCHAFPIIIQLQKKLLQALKQKRAINRKIKFNQQYVKSDEMAQYLLSDQEWTERVYFLYDSLAAHKLTMQQVNYAYHVTAR